MLIGALRKVARSRTILSELPRRHWPDRRARQDKLQGWLCWPPRDSSEARTLFDHQHQLARPKP
ncbi:hypothetical protein B0H67DRAFT_88047 [Lasiosphaeris hirsuta]|uniref:Uncharacterized protein n=1 Tax=Lasiosphaeris hirsuta TaxID=260670 RepID=A0AA40EDZ5_9PEZI|nr:hypothetical protein B0H67DRAFT_88047 [Lasiosphaeris hirsuta]